MEVSQAWFMQTLDGRSFLIAINHRGTFVGLRSAVNYHKEPFYGIEITKKSGKLMELLGSITEKDVVKFAKVKWDIIKENECTEIHFIKSYSIMKTNGEKILSSNNLRFLFEAYDRV